MRTKRPRVGFWLPLRQNRDESSYDTIHMQTCFSVHANQTECFARGIILNLRHKVTLKKPIYKKNVSSNSFIYELFCHM